MFERFTEAARRALFFARYEASQLGAGTLETEHVLLGLAHDDHGLTARLLEAAQLSAEKILAEIESRAAFRQKLPASLEMPFSAEARRGLEYTMAEADSLGHSAVGPEHMLLGLLRVDNSAAASIMLAHGIRLNDLRKQIATQAAGEPAASPSVTPTEISERVERIQRLVQQLNRRLSDDVEAHVLLERIDDELTALRRRLAEVM
jgi:ATP-dependent Clp protease ATP-binding subunit ClpC